MKKWPKPQCPFWRKDIAKNNEVLQELCERYTIELPAIKNLLKVFDGDIIAKCITEKRKVGFKLLKKENQALFLYDLFQLQIKKPIPKTTETVTYQPDNIAPAKTFGSKSKNITL
jgi:hypothetical protein